MRFAFLLVLLLPSSVSQPEAAPCSPVELAVDAKRDRLYVADATRNRVLVVAMDSGKVLREFAFEESPSGLALAPDGSRLFVTGASPQGFVHILDLTGGGSRRSLPAGHMPCSPVVAHDGKTLFFCNRFQDSVAFLDLQTGRVRARVKVTRQPISLALTPDGRTLLAANHLPAGSGDDAYLAAEISAIDTGSATVEKRIPLPNGATSVRAIALTRGGDHALVTHILARYHTPTSQIERGWINTNALTIVDVKARRVLNTVILDDIDLGAANPWGVACSADGRTAVVAHAGTHEVSIIDLHALLEKLQAMCAAEAERVPDRPGFLGSLRRRVPLPGNGPRGIALAAGKAFAAEYFSGSLAICPLDGTGARSVPLSKPVTMTAVRRGEMLFHDGRNCFQHWQSCTSCHPDSRTDALNWDLLNDGFGNPKNTRSMLLAHATPPAMSTGIRPDAEAAVRAGIRHIQFTVRPEEESKAIDAYLKSLEPVPSPHLVNGKPGEAARRGAMIFKRAWCHTCHKGSLFTDLKQYDVGTGRGREKKTLFDTPTLVEVWRTAPYLYDGRAPDLLTTFTAHNPENKHGLTSTLTKEELSDLVAYLLTL